MISDADLKAIAPSPLTHSPSSLHVEAGVPIPKPQRVMIFSPEEWESFTEEWASTLEEHYEKVRRFGGAGDLGIDIAGLCSNKGFEGVWDNYQCKRYDHPLRPSDVWIEIGKVVYYSFKGQYTPPRKHLFVCSRGIGTTLEQLLNKPTELKVRAKEAWATHCQNQITSTGPVVLTGALKSHFDSLDFSLFSSVSVVEMLKTHSRTSFHAVRFGGGLPSRPNVGEMPDAPTASESRYIRYLLDAYSDHLGHQLADPQDLDNHLGLKRDFLRQRERFYHAESLKNFARDTVPEGTFDELKDEIYYGVVDVCESDHASGLERMRETMTHAAAVSSTSNALSSVIKTQDRQGICHQLANDDRLTWVAS